MVERKNHTLITLARTMLDEYNTPEDLWVEAINIAYKKQQPLRKFQRHCDIGFLVGYSSKSKVYRVFNYATGLVEETYDVKFEESNNSQGAHENLDDVGDESLREAIKNILVGDIKPKDDEDDVQVIDPPSSSNVPQDVDAPQPPPQVVDRRNSPLLQAHPQDLIIGSPSKGVMTRYEKTCFIY